MGFWKAVSTALIGLIFSKKVCYHEHGIGCFSNKKPYDNTQETLPHSPDKMQIEFLLYTRKNLNLPQIITRDSSSIRKSDFQGSKNTKFIIHGYNDRGTKEWVREMRKALLKKGNVNVIAVNWQKGADQKDYRQAAANARVVGALIAELMKSLHSTSRASYGSMHLIGHSLGAHVAGYAGERVPGTGRITGLDPAGPLFEKEDPKVRLDPSDAKFVDVIHTDGDSLLELGFGLEKAIGHADFYPNGGTDQPGCPDKMYKHLFHLITGKFKGLKRSVACSHKRVLELFTESITSTCRFKAYPCASAADFKAEKCNSCKTGCTTMGYYAANSKHGTFYLPTASISPFCRKN